MDIGTPAVYTDPNQNTYVGLVVAHDFTMRPVWRAKAIGAALGAIRFKLDGSGLVADGPQAPDDTVATEKVETHLFAFLGFFRDGTTKLFLVAPSDLHPVPGNDAVPIFHPSLTSA